jgi:hypothetical protein
LLRASLRAAMAATSLPEADWGRAKGTEEARKERPCALERKSAMFRDAATASAGDEKPENGEGRGGDDDAEEGAAEDAPAAEEEEEEEDDERNGAAGDTAARMGATRAALLHAEGAIDAAYCPRREGTADAARRAAKDIIVAILFLSKSFCFLPKPISLCPLAHHNIERG